MALHKSLADHDADPPAAWQVRKIANGCWHLNSSLGHALGTYNTRKAAEADKETGFYVNLWEKEGRWMRGEPVAGWRPHAEVQAERERRAAKASTAGARASKGEAELAKEPADRTPAPRLADSSFPAYVQTGPSPKTTWTARTNDQIVAALARKGWSRDSARDACQRAACDGLAATTNNAGDLTAFVTFGNTEVDLWDAEIKRGRGAALRYGAQAPVTDLGPVSTTGGANSARQHNPRRAPGRGR